MKIVVSYTARDKKSLETFAKITDSSMQPTLKRRNSHRIMSTSSEFKLETDTQGEIDNTSLDTWFCELEKVHLSLENITFHDEHGKELDKKIPLVLQFIQAKEQYLQNKLTPHLKAGSEHASLVESNDPFKPQPKDRDLTVSFLIHDAETDRNLSHINPNHLTEKPVAESDGKDANLNYLEIDHQLYDTRDSKDARIKSPVAEQKLDDDSDSTKGENPAKHDYSPLSVDKESSLSHSQPSLAEQKELNLKKFESSLKALFEQAQKILALSSDESSTEFRMYRIAYELSTKQSALLTNYIENNEMTTEEFKAQAHALIRSPFRVRIKTCLNAVEESINVKNELSRHPQLGFISILDHILWCIDLYRLFTGTRLSFLKFAQPACITDVENVEEAINYISATA